jgi:hypothetical protein
MSLPSNTSFRSLGGAEQDRRRFAQQAELVRMAADHFRQLVHGAGELCGHLLQSDDRLPSQGGVQDLDRNRV